MVRALFLNGAQSHLDGAMPGEQDDGHFGIKRANLAQEFKAVHTRHQHVCEDDRRQKLFVALESCQTVLFGLSLVAFSRQQLAQTLARRLFIINDEHPSLRHEEKFSTENRG